MPVKSIKFVVAPLLFIAALIISSCEKNYPSELHRITVTNNSQTTVCPYIPDLDRLAALDTNLPSAKPKLQIVAPGKSANFDINQDWGSVFRNAGVNTVFFYFIDSTVYHTTNWQQIRDSNLILKRADYSVSELEAAGWSISYQ